MLTLIDSSLLIDALRGHERALAFLSSSARADHILSITPVRTEVVAGARDDEHQATLELLSLVDWMDVTVDIADVAGALCRRWRPSLSRVSVVDFLLAAAAIQVGGAVATLNVRDFPMFPDLEPPY